MQFAQRGRRNLIPTPVGASNDGGYLERLLDEVAPAPGGTPLVLAIDALDEVETVRSREIPLFLPRALPNGVYILLSMRPSLPFYVDASSESFDLDEHAEESYRDACEYVRRVAGRSPLHERVLDMGVGMDQFVETLARKSTGNFMYLRHVLPAIATGEYDSRELLKLPIGLQAYYHDHWARMGMLDDPLPHLKLRVLYVLSELIQPMSCDLIAMTVKGEPLQVQQVLTAWRPFLQTEFVDGQARFHLYHASFRDFLRQHEVLSAAGISLEEIRSDVGAELLRGLDDDV